jgi:anti-anti-sigma factor
MAKKSKSAATERALRIDGEMTIYRAIELKQVLLDAVGAQPKLELDLSAVTEIDTAGVQLLMLTKRAAQAARCELRLVGHSPAVLEVLQLFDLAAFFGDPLVVSST